MGTELDRVAEDGDTGARSGNDFAVVFCCAGSGVPAVFEAVPGFRFWSTVKFEVGDWALFAGEP